MAIHQDVTWQGVEPMMQRLHDQLVLRTPRNEQDIERCAAFVSANMRETSGMTAERVLHHFPTLRHDNYFFVEDENTGEVVSNLCLLPWHFNFGGVTLNVAMLEIVATHPGYRKQGLIRAQMAAFHQAVVSQNFDFSIIEGIPYYYRQFGYGYASDHAACDLLPSSRIPDLRADVAPVKLRPACVEDIPHLIAFYNATFAALEIATLRNEAMWRYVLTAAEHPMYMIEQQGVVTGYLCGWRQINGNLLIVESGMTSAETAWALLHFCKAHTASEIVIRWPQESTLLQFCRSLGSVKAPSDQWLIRLNDPAQLLTKLAPIFAARLANSAAVGFSGEVILNLFHQAFQLNFANGQLHDVLALGFVDASMGADGGDLCIPPDAFTRLLFGYRTLAQLLDAWPDIVIRPSRRYLIDTLFPLCRSYFSMPYFYFGKAERAF